MYIKNRLLNWPYCLIAFAFVLGCSHVSEIDLPGFHYLSKKTSLDVADIVVVSDFKKPKKDKNRLIPASVIDRLEHWAQNRFVAAGAKGKAIITIHDAQTVQHGLKKPEDIHVLLNSDTPDSFGVKAAINIKILGSKPYSTGGTDVLLNRHLEIDSDIKLVFRRRLWRQFVQNFINAFDEQVMSNIKAYLPKLILKK